MTDDSDPTGESPSREDDAREGDADSGAGDADASAAAPDGTESDRAADGAGDGDEGEERDGGAERDEGEKAVDNEAVGDEERADGDGDGDGGGGGDETEDTTDDPDPDPAEPDIDRRDPFEGMHGNRGTDPPDPPSGPSAAVPDTDRPSDAESDGGSSDGDADEGEEAADADADSDGDEADTVESPGDGATPGTVRPAAAAGETAGAATAERVDPDDSTDGAVEEDVAEAGPATPAQETPDATVPGAEEPTAPAGSDAAANGGGGGGAAAAVGRGVDAVNDGMDALGGAGPASDEEMPLAEHIEEMMRRLGVVFAVAGVVVVAVLLIGAVSPAVPSASEIIRFLWDAHVGFEQNRPRVYGPLEFLLTKLKVASLAGLLVGLPVFVYETYRFMRPGLYPHERRYYLAAIPTSLVLGLVGVAFAHFIVLPAIFQYFISYTEQTAVLAFGLRETFNLILLLMGYMAIVFQIPLFIQLAIMMGLVTREWMEQRRLLFWSAFVGLAFIVSPDPTGMAPIIVGATMIVLFEGTLALLRWTGN